MRNLPNASEIIENLRKSAAGDKAALERLIAPDVTWDVSSPVEQLTGRQDVSKEFFATLLNAFGHVERRDLLFLSGHNRRAEGGQWVASVCHYVGTFAQPLWGIRPHGRLVFLRAGEFYRIENGQIVLARIILDIPDLLRQTGRLSVPHMHGTEITFPAPATLDGVHPVGDQGEQTLDIIERMIGDLHVFDPETMTSEGQTGSTGVWADDMMWYGPAMIGSNARWDGFVQDHRRPFLTAFPDRKGGNHYCRIGQGNYAAISGWPSMTMTHQGDYLGVKATGKALTLRVMDFYRCVNVGPGRGQIAENWVMLDMLELMQQMGRDLIAEAADLP